MTFPLQKSPIIIFREILCTSSYVTPSQIVHWDFCALRSFYLYILIIQDLLLRTIPDVAIMIHNGDAAFVVISCV